MESPGEGLHDVFAAQAAAEPRRIALIAGNIQVSYGELDARAERLADRLAAAGVEQGHLVPILMPRSVDLVVALLAVLKCGAAYALLDPDWPPTRLDAVVDQLHPPLVVARPGTPARLSAPLWDPSDDDPEHRPARRAAVTVRDTDACCVFFTSGTTGRPKGVVTPHRATARLFGPGTFARFDRDTVVPLAAALPWDAFSLELWAALHNGGTGVLIDEPFLTAEALRALVTGHGVNTVWLTSSLFNLIVDEDLSAMSGLSQLMIGGERLSARHVGRFLDRFPDTALVNGYGPVESTVFTTTHRITVADCARPGGIPLGRAVPGTSVFVLDGDRPCAAGEPGEICVAGDGLAHGYLGEPALTAEKFTAVDILGERVRLYRTGDLGVRDENGIIEFRGRLDRQVKVRGHRVEPAEVERQIVRLVRSVADCRVVPRWNELGGAHELVAFCVPGRPGDTPPDASTDVPADFTDVPSVLTDVPTVPTDVPAVLADVSATLARHLPAHQRPVAVAVVDAFPLTGTGKLDDRALLASLPDTPDETHHGPVDDPLVRLVAQTFTAVLGRRSVPPLASFFELGGSSLQAARACTRIGKRVGRPVPLSSLYEHPSAERLGTWLRTVPAVGVPAPPPHGDIPLTPMELVFLTRHLTAPQDLSQYCVMTWHLDDRLDPDTLEAAVAAVHERHQTLRIAFRADPRPHAEVTDIPAPPLELLDARPTVDEAVLALRALFEEPLEPRDADLWRTALVPLTDHGGWLFGLLVHHIVFDGRSESVLARDLSDAYAGREPGPLPPTPAERTALTAAATAVTDPAARTARVRQEFRDVPELRWPEPADPGDSGTRHLDRPVPAPLAAGLDARGTALGASRFVVLLSAWADTVAEICGQRDFAVGVPVAERALPELERAVGCLIDMVPVRLRGAAVAGGEDGIRETRRLVHEAFGRGAVPFTAVAEASATTPGRPPVFQTLFALQDNPPPRLDLPGVVATHIRQPYPALPLELHLEVWPDEGGALDVVLSYRRDVVAEATARKLLDGFHDRLALIATGAAR
ncbi:amino acid adenylation domain-containing protein [Streptomyces sp. SP17KL33]|uniref:amino acid adenylation domain-containing protein n=1 Tax=Streptomyces sp. SP17KL33 TaxID=3002534 RepID=UPI002E75C665|nr:amino acid adenylation domain-containing protein [Streptomyces sp. SP17KL33]MEE1836250.1 amino acid adenylation domain-containing protein [Streptomyces sp. SP17KL33]